MPQILNIQAAETSETVWVTQDQFVQMHPGLSEWLVRKLVRGGQIRSIRTGKRVLVPSTALDELAAAQALEAGHERD
ncbi:MAG: hypothetical protein U0075_22085 [Thermomicrobiales bacterium]